MNKLKKPKNLRATTPKCCMTCKHFAVQTDAQEDYRACERDLSRNYADVEDYFIVCDYYKVSK